MIRTLIVDDECSVLEMVELLSKKHNIPIEIIGRATDGMDALKKIHDFKPQLVLIDVQMPGLNGLEVIEKTNQQCADVDSVKFIIITGYDLFEYAQLALRLGVKDILLKPIDGKILNESIQKNFGVTFTDCSILNEVLIYIDEHYMEDITLSKTADLKFISPNYLARLFKKHTPKTFNNYLNESRIKKAKELLQFTDKSITDISHTVGYSNLNNFYSQFKKYTDNLTPKAFRKKLNNKVM